MSCLELKSFTVLLNIDYRYYFNPICDISDGNYLYETAALEILHFAAAGGSRFGLMVPFHYRF